MADHKTFPVEVLTPEGQVFNDEVEMLSTRTNVGEVGVLANHAPLLATLDPAELRLHLGGEEVKRYAQAEDILLQDAPIIPIYFQKDSELISPRVQGLRNPLFGYLPHYKVILK